MPHAHIKAKARARGLMGGACIVAWWWHVGVADCGPAKGRGKRNLPGGKFDLIIEI